MNVLLAALLFLLPCLLSTTAHSQKKHQGTKLSPQLLELENVIESFKHPKKKSPKKKKVPKVKIPDFKKNPSMLLQKDEAESKNVYEGQLFF
jgi:hypothetical protein